MELKQVVLSGAVLTADSVGTSVSGERMNSGRRGDGSTVKARGY